MLNIAIDGPSGSGKGALADGLAKKLNIVHLDTGAIFRGIAYYLITNNLSDITERELKSLLPTINLNLTFDNNAQKVLLDGENITGLIRTEQISKLSSVISSYPAVREKFREIVQTFASGYNSVIDGRDITSVILPDAKYRFYLTADEQIRAQRRFNENRERNISCTFEEVLENLRERDFRDKNRKIAPLIIAPGVTVIDNSKMSIDETINFVLAMIETHELADLV